MNFYKMYMKKIKEIEQEEDYLTELTALLIRISPNFKKKFLDIFQIEVNNFNNISVETQVSDSIDSKNIITDMQILEGENLIAIFEHKIGSKIGKTQIDDYYEKYKDICKKYFLISSKRYSINEEKYNSKKHWNFFTWEKIYEEIENFFFNKNVNSEEFEVFKKKEGLDCEKSIIYFYLEFLWSIDLNKKYYEEEFKKYNNSKEFVREVFYSKDFFDKLKKIVRETNSNPNAKGSEIDDFINNNRVHSKIKENYYIGFFPDYVDDNILPLVEFKEGSQPPLETKYSYEKNIQKEFEKLTELDFLKQLKKVNECLNDYKNFIEYTLEDNQNIRFGKVKCKGNFLQCNFEYINKSFNLNLESNENEFYFFVDKYKPIKINKSTTIKELRVNIQKYIEQVLYT